MMANRDSRAVASRQAGVALAIVVWFIAGMSLLVAGIVAQARVDTHMAQIHLARARAVAAGDGAIQLMMIDLLASPQLVGDAKAVPQGDFRVGEMEVRVVMVPTSALVDLNAAAPKVLSDLFATAAGVDGSEAMALAANVVKSRSVGPAVPGRRQSYTLTQARFAAIEDVLRVDGMSRTLLDSIRDFIVVGESGSGAAGSRSYRADAILRYGDRTWLRRRWIELGASAGTSLPWRMFRTEAPRVVVDGSIILGGSFDV